MYTANTMSSAIEAMGMSLPYSSTMAAEDAEKADSAARSGEVLVEAMRRATSAAPDHDAQGVRERDRGGDGGRRLDQRRAASARDRARGAKCRFTIDDFETIRQRVPVLCDLKPSGRYVATELHRAGGIPQVMKMLLAHGLLHGDAMTITGKTIAETLAEVPDDAAQGSGRDPSVGQSDVRAGASRDPARQPRHRRRGREDHRESKAAR